MKKEILLTIGIIALLLAAKEYGFRSVDDIKTKASPLLKLADLYKSLSA